MIYATRILDTIEEYESDVMFDIEANNVSYIITYDELNKSIILKESATYLFDGDDWGFIDNKTKYYTIDVIRNVTIKEYVQTLTYIFNNSYVLKDMYSILNKIVFDDDITIIS